MAAFLWQSGYGYAGQDSCHTYAWPYDDLVEWYLRGVFFYIRKLVMGRHDRTDAAQGLTTRMSLPN